MMRVWWWNSGFDTHHDNDVKTQMSNKFLLQIFMLLVSHFVCLYHTEVVDNSVKFVGWLHMLYIKMFLYAFTLRKSCFT